MEQNMSLVPAGPLMGQAPEQVTEALGAPPEEVGRIKELMTRTDEIRITPIKIVYDARFGLGVFISGSLLEYAACHGPHFNSPDRPGLKITNLEAFVRAFGRELLSPREDETIIVGLMCDEAILAAVNRHIANPPDEPFIEYTPVAANDGQPEA